MKLYFSPGACSLAPHIALREAAISFDLVKVDIHTGNDSEQRYKAINPKGYVPALELADGTLLTETSVLLQWIGHQAQNAKLLPVHGTLAWYRAMEWLTFIATELHKGFGPLFSPLLNEVARDATISRLRTRLVFLNNHLASVPLMLGSTFSVVDAYAYNILRWSVRLNVDISSFVAIGEFMARIAMRESVRASISAEGAAL